MTRRTLSRLLLWTAAVAFVALAVWWCLYFPYDARRLYGAIPEESVFVSEHERLAERWDAFLANPITRTLLVSAGVTPAEADAWAQDPGIRALVERIGARDTVVAYVPNLDGRGHPAWVASSWIGGTGQFMRWGLASGAGMEKTELEDGQEGWRVETGRPEKLTLAVNEGVLLACYSEDPLGVSPLLRRLEVGAPLRPELEQRIGARSDGCLDRGWFGAYLRQGRGKVPCAFRYTLSAHDAGGSEGRVRGQVGGVKLPAAPDGGVAARFAGLGLLAGNRPDVVAAVPYAAARPLLNGPGVAKGIQTVAGALDGVAAPDAYLCGLLFGGETSGRILGLRVPTVVFAVQVASEKDAQAALTGVLDRLNARYGWSLIPRRVEENGNGLVVLDSGREGLYASIGPRERPAYGIKDGWLVLASNLDALSKLLGGKSAAGGKPAAWRAGAGEHESVAYAWADLESVGQAARNAIAVYSLALIAQNSPGTDRTRKSLEDAKAWIGTFTPLRTGILWLGSQGDDLDLRFRLGTPNVAATAR